MELAPQAAHSAREIHLEGRFEQWQERRYSHVPFEVPDGVRALRISYDYSERIPSDPLLSGGNTLDIGVFDPRGTQASSHGFRGWSGSEKRDFIIGEHWATPPYTPGLIQPGTWNILLGPYKVSERGCDYRVSVQLLAAAPARPDAPPGTTAGARPPANLTPAAEQGWLRGDLHCHTLHSDGDSWPAEMVARAIERGLDFLGVTDHNQVNHHAAYARVTGDHLPILLYGDEVTTYRGHWNVWGTRAWWEFREADETAVSRTMQAAAKSGALVSVNHPKPFGPAWEYRDVQGYHAIEVWNGDWARLNSIALAWWEEQLRAGQRIVAVGGSDTHHLHTADPDLRHARDLGLPTTWVQVGEERTSAAVLEALRAGRSFLSRGPDGPQLYVMPVDEPAVLSARIVGARGAVFTLITEDGVVSAASIQRDDWSTEIRLPSTGARLYVRAQVTDTVGDMLALSNPLRGL